MFKILMSVPDWAWLIILDSAFLVFIVSDILKNIYRPVLGWISGVIMFISGFMVLWYLMEEFVLWVLGI